MKKLLFLLPLVILLISCKSTGLSPINKKYLSGGQTKSAEYISTTNTVFLVQPSKTITVEIPKEYIEKHVNSSNLLRIEVEIPAITNTVKLIDNKPRLDKSFYSSGSFLMLYYGGIAAVFSVGYLIWKYFFKKKNLAKPKNLV